MDEIKTTPIYDGCFGCGKNNPIGLHLNMKRIDDHCEAVFTPQKEHESYGDRMHGGLVTTLLDEVMGDYVLKVTGVPTYTAEIDVRFRHAVPIGKPLTITGWITKQRGRLVVTEGQVKAADGTVMAEATAKMMMAK